MSTKAIEAEVSIRSGVDAEVEVGRGITVNVADVTLESLEVTENGQYVPGAGVDGYSDVTVQVPVYSGETEITPGDEDITLDTGGQIVPDDILIHGIPQVPHTVIAYGSFTKQGTSVTYTLDTHSTRWTRLLIKPHTFPHTGMAASAISRAIMTKYIDLELDAMITAYMSSAGTAYNAGSYRRISTGDECDVTNGVVHMTGESSTTGKWINGIQYDWYAWNDGVDPTEANVIEGYFTGTETGVLTVDTGYTGSGFAKAIIIHPDTGIMGLDDDFFDNTPRHAINALSYFKISKAAPTYPETLSGAENQMRFVYMFKSTETAYSTSNATVYVMTTADNPGQYGTQGFVRMPDNHTLQVFTASEPSGTTAYLPTGIRFKYQIFY